MVYHGIFLLALLSLVGCATVSPLAPATLETVTHHSDTSEPTVSTHIAPDFNLSQLSSLAPTDIEQTHVYSLAELIDLAQQNNPLTRIAWLEAEQAAIAAGMVKATYLPILSASVIGGYQRTKFNSELDVGPFEIRPPSARTTISGVVPALSLKWLLFDFGKREALHGAALDLAFASRAKFTATHQAIIFNVSRTFFELNTARQNTKLAQQHLTNSNALKIAAQARFKEGVATSIEVAQANQLAAQAKLMLVQRQGVERDTYQSLLAAVGLDPTIKLQVETAADRKLPRFEDLPNDQALQAALAYRPDLIATDAARKAAEKGIDSAYANFMPKIALIGVASTGSTSFNVNGLGETGPHSPSRAVLLGVSIPIYDGGLRRMQLREAEARAQAARELVRKTQNDALREMHLAANALRSALEAYEASSELVNAATLTNDAASDAYRVGVGNMMIATEAANGLLDATQAQSVAYAAALIASANLAFMMGQLNQAPAAQNAVQMPEAAVGTAVKQQF